MEVLVTTGAIRRTKLQSIWSPPTNQHPTFYRPDALPVANQQCQSTEVITSCRRAAATICPRQAGLQRKHTAAALSQADQAGSNQPIHAARQPDVHNRCQTDRCQTASSLNAPWVAALIIVIIKSC